jgi:ABC-2 type transport system permease protein
MREVLAHYGVNVEETLVMDPQNEPFPVAMSRNVGGIQVQEIQSMDYPYFVDVRADGMAEDSPLIANLPAVTLNWVSPVQVDEDKANDSEVATLLHSSPNSWLRSDLNIQPNPDLYPEYGFPTSDERDAYPLAVSVLGSFDSYFTDREPPVPEAGEDGSSASQATLGTIEQSPPSARLIVIGSGDFLNDTVFSISSQISFDRYLNSLQFIQNAVDWSVEDLDLLNIRSRGGHVRMLDPLEPNEESFWEILNYAAALLAIVAIGLLWASRRRQQKPMKLHTETADGTGQEVSHEQA